MALGLLFEDEKEELPLALASDRGLHEIRDFLHLHGHHCRPSCLLTWPKLFPEPEYDKLLAAIPERNPKGVNWGRHSFYRLRGDLQYLARKLFHEVHFTRFELQFVLGGFATYQSLFDWQRHVRKNTFYSGQGVEVVDQCLHKDKWGFYLARQDCPLCAIPDGCARPPQVTVETSGGIRVTTVLAAPAKERAPKPAPTAWQRNRGHEYQRQREKKRQGKIPPPKGQTGGSL